MYIYEHILKLLNVNLLNITVDTKWAWYCERLDGLKYCSLITGLSNPGDNLGGYLTFTQTLFTEHCSTVYTIQSYI